MSYERPYEGIKIVDLSQGIAGPYGAMLLAQYGANVIKVEPLHGDWSRNLGKRYGNQTAFSVIGNLGKRSLAVDLKTDEGKSIVQRLADEADVFLEGFRPGVISRLGFGYEALSQTNPRLLYVSVSGFGQQGPLRERPATDSVLQAFSGFMSVNKGSDDMPHKVNMIVVDMPTALHTFQVISAALFAREREAEGRYIDNNLMQASAAFQAVNIVQASLEGPDVVSPVTPSGTYAASDGTVNVTILQDHEFARLCDAIDHPELKDDPRFQTNRQRFANRERLEMVLRESFAKAPVQEWQRRLSDARILHEKVNNHVDFLNHPQAVESQAVSWIDHPQVGRIPIPYVPGTARLASSHANAYAPDIGEHSADILRDLGYRPEQIADLQTRHVIVDSTTGS